MMNEIFEINPQISFQKSNFALTTKSSMYFILKIKKSSFLKVNFYNIKKRGKEITIFHPDHIKVTLFHINQKSNFMMPTYK